MNEDKCCERVFEASGFSYLCTKKAVIVRDGKPYCKIHDPEYRNAKRVKLKAKWDAESKAQQERWALEEARDKAVKGLTLEELYQVTPDLIRKALRQKVYENAMNKEA